MLGKIHASLSTKCKLRLLDLDTNVETFRYLYLKIIILPWS